MNEHPEFRIYVDFNNVDDNGLVSINWATNIDVDLASLSDGHRIILYDEDIEVEAVIDRKDERDRWLAKPNWGTRRPFSG